MSDRTIEQLADVGRINDLPGMVDPTHCVAAKNQRAVRRGLPADTAGTTARTFRLATLDRPVTAVSARIAIDDTANVSSSASQYVTYSLFYDNDAGGGSGAITATGASTNGVTMLSQQSQPFSLIGGLTIPAGSAIYCQESKTGGTGVSMPLMLVDLVVQEV